MTMGQPNKRSKTTTTAKRAPTKAAPAAASSPTSRRGQASKDIRQAVEGREHEFAGIGFIAVGVLLGLAIYLDLAGPLGRGVETVVGWLTGLGRYVVPIALVAIGAALVGKGQSLRRARLALGWGLLGLSLLGLLHVVRGPEKIMADFDTLGRAGGWIGALVGEPLRGLIASGGAIVVLVAACVGGALVLTGASLRTMLSQTGKGVGAVAVPIGRKARTAFGNVSTLKSDRQGSGELPMPTIYDAALDEDWDEPATPRKPKASRTLPAPGLARSRSGRAVRARARPRRTTWPVGVASGQLPQPIDTADHQQGRGRGAWPHVGRCAHLARRRDQASRPDRRADRHPLRARARLRCQGRQGHQPQPRHRLRDGRNRRAHPGPHSGSHRHRRRGAEPHPPAGQPRRHHVVAGSQDGDPSARRGHRQGHRRSIGVPQPGHHPAPADRRHDRRRQVQRAQLHPHVHPHAQHSRPGATHPHRPEAGRDGPVQPLAAPADPTGDQSEEGRQRTRLGRQGDGAPLRPAVRGRLPRHHRLQRRVRPRRAEARARIGPRLRTARRTSSSSSTSSTI